MFESFLFSVARYVFPTPIMLDATKRFGVSRIKLRPQTLGNDTVSRTRLFARLDARRPLTLVEAPAGYGKTTLVIDWLAHIDVPFAWVTIDEYDNSLTTFLGVLLASIRTVFPDTCNETLALLNAGSSPPDSVIASAFTNELEGIGTRFVLVLDEYHSIKNLAIHGFMTEILNYQPINLEIVLITRHDPPLPLPAMRARNRLTEIRTRELRFSREESLSFLQLSGGNMLAAEQLELLEQNFEGWIAGLRMAVLLRQQEGEGAENAVTMDGSSRYAAEYLTREVINTLPAATREFLVKTSHADLVSAPLAAAILGNSLKVDECAALLEGLARDNLFVFPVHGEETWYRYHALFRSALNHIARNEHSAQEIASFYAQASAFLAQKGDVDSALVYAIRSGDLQAVANLVRDHRHLMLNHWHWSTIETWRRIVPRAMLESHPELLILDAWHYSHLGYIKSLEGTLEELRVLLARTSLSPDDAHNLRAEIDVMTAQVTYWTSDASVSANWAKRALDGCRMDHSFNRVFAWLFYVVGLENSGREAAADAASEEAISEGVYHRGTVYPIYVCTIPCFVFLHRADMVHLDEIASHMLTLAQGTSHLEGIAWALFFRGCARYQRNDLAGAERDFTTLTKLKMSYIAHPLAFSQVYTGLAATYQAKGESEKGYETALQGWELLLQSDYPIAAARSEGMMAFLAFRQGKTEQALHWVSRPLLVPIDSPLPFFNSAVLGRITVLLGLDTIETRIEAAELLERFRGTVDNLHSTRFLIEVYALRAVLLAQSGVREGALELLEHAVQLTVTGDAIRTLADLDFLLGSLLDELAEYSPAKSQIHRIRRAAQAQGRGANTKRNGFHGDERLATQSLSSSLQTPVMIESLTYREMDVLQMLVERPTNKEIALSLSISTETVKRHLVNIFQKLSVENRRQAVIQARNLGILPDK